MRSLIGLVLFSCGLLLMAAGVSMALLSSGLSAIIGAMGALSGLLLALATFVCGQLYALRDALQEATGAGPDAQYLRDGGHSAHYKLCPLCLEAVRKAARRCRHCGADLPLAPAHPLGEPFLSGPLS